ncbi:MAG: hypothetical protein Q4F41_13990 [Eubacteriales bacterium]|nr:hypothetical protein [Eubacteriales bacterium]
MRSREVNMNGMFTIRKSTLMIVIVMILMHNVFYLAPNSFGPISYADFLFLFSIGVVFYYFTKDRRMLFRGNFARLVWMVPMLIFLSSFAAWYNYGQPITSGILTQRYWFSTIFLYFFFVYMIEDGKLDYDFFFRILNGIVIVELILYFTQFFIGDTFMFLNINHNYRYGTLRLYCNTNYMVLAALNALFRGCSEKKSRVFNFALTAAVILYFFLVNKGRSATIGFMIGLAMVVLFSPVRMRYKILIGAIAFVIGLNYLWTSTLVQDFWGVVVGGQMDGTYNVRLRSQEFYMKKWQSSPVAFILGYGYGNSKIGASMVATGASQGFGYADNGLYGFVSCYGVVGLLWYLLFCSKRVLAWWKARDGKGVIVLASLIMMLTQYKTIVSYFYTQHSFEAVMVMTVIELILREKNGMTTED